MTYTVTTDIPYPFEKRLLTRKQAEEEGNFGWIQNVAEIHTRYQICTPFHFQSTSKRISKGPDHSYYLQLL